MVSRYVHKSLLGSRVNLRVLNAHKEHTFVFYTGMPVEERFIEPKFEIIHFKEHFLGLS